MNNKVKRCIDCGIRLTEDNESLLQPTIRCCRCWFIFANKGVEDFKKFCDNQVCKIENMVKKNKTKMIEDNTNIKLQNENKRLKSKKHIILTQVREMALFTIERIRERRKWQDTKIENEQLKKKIKIIQKGLPTPNFEKVKKNASKLINMEDPESAFFYGWASAELECGEVLSKP